jgi:hypothetical protein
LEDRNLLSGNPVILPYINDALQARLQTLFAQGQQMGNQPDVFSKVGDSITAMPFYLNPLGDPGFDPTNPAFVGSHTDLSSTIELYRSFSADDQGNNSFTHASWAATPGWTSADVLNPAHNLAPARAMFCLPTESPLQSELRLTRPSVALIMIGTNDLLLGVNPEVYRANLTAIVYQTVAAGVIPVLSSIPDIGANQAYFAPRVAAFNQVISEVAAATSVPFLDYHLGMQLLPNQGIGFDTVHPSVYPGGSGFLTDVALNYGFNVRNFLTVEVLDKIQRVVVNDGVPDTPSDQGYSAATVGYVNGLYQAVLGHPGGQPAVATWGPFLEASFPRSAVAMAVWNSPEHRGQQVDRMYLTLLHRPADPVGRAGAISFLITGGREDRLAINLLNSAEYQLAHPTNVSLVAGLYQDVLGHPASPDALATWVGILQSGVSRPAVVQAIVTSAEADQRLVDSYYQTILRRPADFTGEQIWVGTLLNGQTTPSTLAVTFLISDEFVNLFRPKIIPILRQSS